MSNAHTPGPWLVATSNSWRRIVNSRGLEVCTPTLQHSDKHPDLCFPNGGAEGADARLIAAAPELLEALQPFVTRNSSEESITLVLNTSDVKRARAAIAKATGVSDD